MHTSYFRRHPNLYLADSLLATAMPIGYKPFYTPNALSMNSYELMVIFTPVLSEEEFKTSQKKYADIITENGGTVVHSNPWGLKSLAYPINKKTTGIYWVLEFGGPPDLHEKLKIQMLRDEQIMRHLVLRLDKYAVEYCYIKRTGGFANHKQNTEA